MRFMAILLGLLVGWMAALLAFGAWPGLQAAGSRLRAARTSGAPARVPGDAAPLPWLDRIFAARRLERIRAQLPEAIVGLATSVRAGLSLPQAVQAAGERVPEPLGPEFRAVGEACALGATLERALDALERRAPLAETRLLVAGCKLSRVTGGALAPLLDRLADTLRERERLRGQVRALTAQGRLSGAVVGSLPVLLLGGMAVFDPAFLRPMVSTPAGWLMLGAAVCLELLGLFAIRAVTRVEP